MRNTVLAASLVSGLLSTFGVAQSIGFAINKQAGYQQFSDAGPTLDAYSAAWSFAVDTDGAFADPCSVSFASPISPVSMYFLGDMLPVGDVWYAGSNAYADLASLDADIPAGDYQFDYSANVLPAGSFTMTLPPSMFCAEAPTFTGDTWSRLQAIQSDLGSDFEGTINGFTNVPGSNQSGIQVLVYDYSHGGIYYNGVLPPEATSFTIPGGAIEPGYAYYIYMAYSTGVANDTGGIGDSYANVGFTRNLVAYFNTRGSCPADLNADGLVDDQDFVLFVAAYNVLYCSDPTMPEKCGSDLTNDGYVQDDDFVAFVPAYNQLVCEP